MPSLVRSYLAEREDDVSPAFLAYLANLETVAQVAPAMAHSVVAELADQAGHLKMIASENYSSLATQAAMGNLLTDKYAEGVAGKRFYAGCGNVDVAESFAAEEAKKLFGCDHAYVQPHSGADANMIAFWAILSKRVQEPYLAEVEGKDIMSLSDEQWTELRRRLGDQGLLGMDLFAGGHLTHGYRHNVSGKMFRVEHYGVGEDGLIDYDALEQQAESFRPLILLAGYSAYPRKVDFARMRKIADKVGAVLMVDMAHFAGLVAGKVLSGDFDPVAHADIVTSTTHKTLRGPRGGIILCTEEYAEQVDRGCPLVIGGPLPHVMAAKGVAFHEANQPAFRDYAAQVAENATTLAAAMQEAGLTVVTGGTDNHIVLVDLRPQGITGRQGETVLRECGITLNRNTIPNDPNGPWYTSGLRFGTPALTTRGLGADAMREVGQLVAKVLTSTEAKVMTKGKSAGKPSKVKYVVADEVIAEAKQRVQALLDAHPLYPELDLPFLQAHFSG